MKIALFTVVLNSYESKRLTQAASDLGHEMITVPMQTLVYSLQKDGKIDITVNESNMDEYVKFNQEENIGLNLAQVGEDLTKFDAVIIRGASRKGEPKQVKLKLLVFRYYQQFSTPVLNGESQEIKADNKLWQHYQFIKAGVPVVPTKFIANEKLIEEATSGMSFPIFAKRDRGSHGVATIAPKNVEEFKTFYKEADDPAYILTQQNLRTNWDVRAIVVGDKVLGGMKRTAQEGSHISNFSAGGEIEKVELTQEEEELALKAAKSCGAEYGGADLMRDEMGNIYVLEFNRNASFKGFEQATQVNVAKEVINYILSRK